MTAITTAARIRQLTNVGTRSQTLFSGLCVLLGATLCNFCQSAQPQIVRLYDDTQATRTTAPVFTAIVTRAVSSHISFGESGVLFQKGCTIRVTGNTPPDDETEVGRNALTFWFKAEKDV
jgi:hypothetical protein